MADLEKVPGHIARHRCKAVRAEAKVPYFSERKASALKYEIRNHGPLSITHLQHIWPGLLSSVQLLTKWRTLL